MATDDNDNGKQFHITLNSYDRQLLNKLRAKFGTSWSGAIRAAIRAIAEPTKFKPPPIPHE